jgi:hypothetical protein
MLHFRLLFNPRDRFKNEIWDENGKHFVGPAYSWFAKLEQVMLVSSVPPPGAAGFILYGVSSER